MDSQWAQLLTEPTEVEVVPVSSKRKSNFYQVNRPPSASNRGLAVGPVVGGARGTAIIGGTGMVDPAASRGAFSLNIHGTNGKSFSFRISKTNFPTIRRNH